MAPTPSARSARASREAPISARASDVPFPADRGAPAQYDAEVAPGARRSHLKNRMAIIGTAVGGDQGGSSPPPGFPRPRECAWEPPRQADHGDYATNVAMILAREAKRPPRQLAELIARHLPEASRDRLGSRSPARASSTSFSRPPGARARFREILERGGALRSGRCPAWRADARRVRLGQSDRASGHRERSRGGGRRCPGPAPAPSGRRRDGRVLHQRRRHAGRGAGPLLPRAGARAWPTSAGPAFPRSTRGCRRTDIPGST